MSSKKGKRESDQASRLDLVDGIRGIALLWMAAFHFCFDLANVKLLDANFYQDPLWTVQRTCILSMFLLCAGAGQALAVHQGQPWARFWRREGQILACALLVSLASYLAFPRSYISFGVLHGMVVMLLVARLTAPLGRWLWLLGLLALAAPHLVSHPFFDTRWTNWLGLVTHKPVTEDYVPVLPWLGVMWWGLAATQWALKHHPAWLATRVSGTSGDNAVHAHPASGAWRLLVTLGRWSLSFYMVHQPVLIGALLAWMALTGRELPAF